MTMGTKGLRIVLWALVVTGGGVGPSRAVEEARRDRHSWGNPEQVRVVRVNLNLIVDFERKELRGGATLTVARQPDCPRVAPLVLDTRGLAIVGVWANALGEPEKAVPFRVGAADPVLGAPLTIELPADATQVLVTYRTRPESSALQWLQPEQTAGKTAPFVFTQSEAIHARSWVPLQDSPGVRVTYAARIEVPPGLTALMSAAQQPSSGNVFRFEMSRPVAPYLIALAVGKLSFLPLGPRTGVYAEPPVVEDAAKEFFDTEALIAALEKRYGPYRWGRYDLLVLPPSFPFGGMENPMLTFATPTILAGDKSLVSLVAHELAHSWSGNLVTNATWSDFWLNEGFTVYLERRTIADVFGPERAAMEAVLGLKRLRAELKQLPQKDQVLHIDLTGRDPDTALTGVPYEKGALLLTTLEHAVGRDRFDAYLRGYFDRFAFQSITTADFAKDLRTHLPESDKVDVSTWLYQPGLPSGYPGPHSERFTVVERAAQEWWAGTTPARGIETKDWSTQEWLHFLQALPETVPSDRLAELDRAFHFTRRGNAEVVAEWLLIAIKNDYAPANARLETFLTTIGRRKYLMPLYTALAKNPEGKARARAWFEKARPGYHPITAESVDRLLNGKN